MAEQKSPCRVPWELPSIYVPSHWHQKGGWAHLFLVRLTVASRTPSPNKTSALTAVAGQVQTIGSHCYTRRDLCQQSSKRSRVDPSFPTRCPHGMGRGTPPTPCRPIKQGAIGQLNSTDANPGYRAGQYYSSGALGSCSLKRAERCRSAQHPAGLRIK